mgnify:FL=1
MPQTMTSPVGEALYPMVLGPARQMENDPKKFWSMGIRYKVEDDNCQKFITYIRNQYVEHHGKKAEHPNGMPFVEEMINDELTGYIKFKFKKNELTKNGDFSGAPRVVTADPNINWPQDKLIGNGSLVKASFSLFPWEMTKKGGVSLYLQAVQVLKHVPYEADGTDAFKVEEKYIQDIPTDVGSVASTNPDITSEDLEF